MVHGGHRTQEQKESDRLRVAELYLQRRPMREIARVVGLNRKTVALDIKAVQERWALDHPGEYAAKLAEQLARIDLIELKAWECFERSVGERKRSRTRLIQGAMGASSLAETNQEELFGEATYLRLVCWCVEQRGKFLGLYSSEKRSIQLEYTVPIPRDWDEEFERLDQALGAGKEGSLLEAGDRLPHGFVDPA